MSRLSLFASFVLGLTALLGSGLVFASDTGEPSPTARAIEYRKAVYTVIGGNFAPLGAVLRGRSAYDPSDARIRAQRLAFMARLAVESFPDISKDGDTKARPEVWTDPNGFKMAMQALVDSTTALSDLLQTAGADSIAFKAAVGKVAESCKSCHDKYKAK
jgi:cytochrome c556